MTEWEKLALKIEQQDWRDLAASIAITVISLLAEKGMTKQQLADKMGVKAQYVSRVVKGKTNLTLDTIAKIEKALGESIISVYDPTSVIEVNLIPYPLNMKWDIFLHTPRKVVAATKTKRQPKVEYSENDQNYAIAS